MIDKEKKEHTPDEVPENTELELVGLEAENIKALRAVKLGLKGKSLVVVGGNNAQGKTSLLDCIPIALGGKKYEPEEVIRRGESHGKIVLDLDEVWSSAQHSEAAEPIGLKITVVFTKKAGRKVILEAKDGFPFRSPQEIFDRFVNRMTFDPLEFIRLDKEKQTEVVRKMAGIDFTKLDQEYQGLYDNRRDLNRDLKNTEGAVSKIELPSNRMENWDNPTDIPSLIAQRDVIQIENKKNDDRMRKLEQLGKDIKTKWETSNRLFKQIEELQKNNNALIAEIHEMEAQFEDWSTRSKSLTWQNTDEIDAQIDRAQVVNSLIEKKKLRDQQLEQIKSINEKVEGIETQMEGIKEQKAKMLASAKYPVPGFKIDSEGMLLYNDLPFSQASGMQQIDVAIDMALAINPRLKLALVREGSIIDLENLKRIHARVEAAGGKLIMERTGKSAEMSVIIEDGEIIENNL